MQSANQMRPLGALGTAVASLHPSEQVYVRSDPRDSDDATSRLARFPKGSAELNTSAQIAPSLHAKRSGDGSFDGGDGGGGGGGSDWEAFVQGFRSGLSLREQNLSCAHCFRHLPAPRPQPLFWLVRAEKLPT